jgi:hypothetical protein
MSIVRPSTLTWVTLHLGLPLLPFTLEGFIRLAVAEGAMTLEIFRASTLAMSIGLLSIFVHQSLRSCLLQPSDETELESIAAAAAAFLAMAIAFFVLFGILALLNSLVHDRDVTILISLLRLFQAATFVGWLIPIVTAVAAQRSFKLKASIR